MKGSPKKKRKAWLVAVWLAAITVILTGCAQWSKPGATEADFYRDQYECEKDAAPQRDPVAAFYMQRRCMQMKGWRD